MKTRLIARLLCCFILYSPGGRATTLLEMDIDSIAADAELIFQGSVVDRTTVREFNGRYKTYVTFSVAEVIKGTFQGDSLELGFLGGSIDGRGLEVSGLRQPGLGETGIYFVESLSDDLVNPLLGWSQGQFLIVEDTRGVGRVTTVRGQPILEIRPLSQVPEAIRRPLGIVAGSSSRAAGIVIEEARDRLDQGLTAEEFKTRIREILDARQD